MPEQQKRYVLVGASGRSLYMYAQPITTRFSHCAKIVGIYDINSLRSNEVKLQANLDCPIYDSFEAMITETKPDAAIITTVDRFHHEYAIKCMEAGIDVISEKPMTMGAEQVSAILECEKRTGRKFIVTFNYRYTPYVTAIKQAIKNGAIGDILNVDFEYLLDTTHGADYFRRWHRKKENCGGLLVHKSTHHFDLVNWWIDAEPEEVMAFGTRRFYGPTRENRGERCLTCEHKNSCEFYYDMTKDSFAASMYLNCESADGYFRDQCVFADEIDIEDSMSVNVRYAGGALLSYSLIAHSPYEGWKIAISGTKGRLEAAEYHSGMKAAEPSFTYDIYDRLGAKTTYTVPKSTGGHGGGDERLLKMLFEGNMPDPLGHTAGSFAGAVSCLIGISANKSIAEHRNILISDLVPLDDYRK